MSAINPHQVLFAIPLSLSATRSSQVGMQLDAGALFIHFHYLSASTPQSFLEKNAPLK